MLLGLHRRKNNEQIVSTVLHSVGVYGTISKIQRLRKLLPRCSRVSTTEVTQNELFRSPDRPRPLLVTLGTEAEQTAALDNVKNLQDTCCRQMFVHKCLTKKEKRSENKIFEKFRTLNERNVPIANVMSLLQT